MGMDMNTVINNLSDDELLVLANEIKQRVSVTRVKDSKIEELCIKNSYDGTVTEMVILMAELNVMYECGSRWIKIKENK